MLFLITFIGIDELGSRVSREHVDDDDLPPLVNIDQKGAKFAVVFVDEVDPIWTHFLKCGHHGTLSGSVSKYLDEH